MLQLFITLCISAEMIDGGWVNIPIDSEKVQHVKPYLDSNIPHLFPELENGGYSIISAKSQIVAGVNLKLTIKASSSPLSFELTLYINLEDKISITDIKKSIDAKPIIGGYMWQNPSHFTPDDLSHAVKLIRSHIDLLIKDEGTIIVYRTKIQKGLTTHIIFRDSMNTICSAVFYIDTDTKEEKFISAFNIY